MAIISLVFDPALDPKVIMNKLYNPKPTLGESDDIRVFNDDTLTLVANYSKRIAQFLERMNPMTVSCALAGLYELGIAETYMKVISKPLTTVGAWLT